MNSQKRTQPIQLLTPAAAGTLQVGAEAVGTFLICFAVYAASSWGRISTGASSIAIACTWVCACIAVGAMFSKISSAHCNPAVTFAAMFTGQIGWLQGVFYILGQLIGAAAAGAAVIYLLPMTKENNGQVWLPGAVNGFAEGSPSYATLTQYHLSFTITMAIVVELVASLIVVGTTIVSMKKDGQAASGHVWKVALAYGVGAMITYPITGAGLNPARSTGIALFARNKGLQADPVSQLFVFWICPLLAAAIVGLITIIYNMIIENAKETLEAEHDTIIEMPEALLTSTGEYALKEPDKQTDLLVSVDDNDSDEISASVHPVPAESTQTSQPLKEPKDTQISDEESNS